MYKEVGAMNNNIVNKEDTNFKKKTDEELRKKIGKNIHLARITANFTQEQLAEKTGLSSRYIGQLERGLAFGSASTISCLCNALSINADVFFSNVIESSNNSLLNVISDDDEFIQSYLKLNEKNKDIIRLIIKYLLKLQK